MKTIGQIQRRIWPYFWNSTPYLVAREIRKSLHRISNKEMRERSALEKVVILLRPEGVPRGRVLFSYMIKGFLLEPGSPIPKTHTNFWQSLKMAETFVELGYEVDAISYTNFSFVPKGNYSFVVDVRHNLQRLAALLNEDCVRIMHLDTAHILFHNAAESKRLLQLQERRGVTLRPRRWEMPNLGIEYADYATTVANDFTIDTYKYANKKIFTLPHPCGIMLDWPTREWNQCRKHFLWLSSSGLVHKGLDLALEAFSGMSDCYLTVCAPLDRERDFVHAYHKELYETPNIKTVGWVDIDSKEFRDLTSTCVAMLHLSCSEGGGTCVKLCMHAGLIPIVSYESSVDVHDFGFTLDDCSIANIINIVRHVASLPKDELQDKAHKAWEFARHYHTRENFAKAYRRVILEIIADVQANQHGHALT